MKGYKFILKVTKFKLPTIYRLSTAEETAWLWVDSAPSPGLLGLLAFRENLWIDAI